MKNLSKDFLSLNNKTDLNFYYDCQTASEAFSWENFPITSLTSVPDSSHYYAHFGSNKKLPIDSNSNCVVYRIENGYFAGCYAIVELNARSRCTDVIIANLTKVLSYISVNKILTIDEIDALMENENIAKTTARILKTYDITATRQQCISFCNNLPEQCYLDNSFLKNVVGYLSSIHMNIIGTTDPELVKISVCEKRNLDVFKKNLVEAKKANTDLAV